MLSKLNHIILYPLLWLVSIVPLKVLYIKSLILSNFFFYRNDIIKIPDFFSHNILNKLLNKKKAKLITTINTNLYESKIETF